jgi:hypothetical protein
MAEPNVEQLVAALQKADAAGDTAAAQAIAAAIKQRQSAQPAQPKTADPKSAARSAGPRANLFDATLYGVGQGISFGYSDELAAGLAGVVKAPFSPKTVSQIRDEQLAIERANLEAVRRDFPKVALATEIGGGMAQGGTLWNAGRQLLPRLPGLVRLAGVGAAEGALYGSGTAEEGERVEGAVTGGVTGAVVPTVLAPVLKPVGRAAVHAFRRLIETPSSASRRLILETLERDGLTPDDALRRLEELGPQARLADLGENMAALAREATSAAGPVRNAARDFLEERAAGQRDRFIDTTGLGDVAEFKQGIREFMNRRHGEAAALYEEARAATLDLATPAMQSLLNRPRMQTALNRAARVLADEGVPVTAGNEVRLIDAAKRVLDDSVSRALRGGGKGEARRIMAIRDELLREVDRQVPVYAQARAAYAGEMAMTDAVRLGRNLFARNVDLDAAEDAVGAMVTSEREAFQRGVLAGLVDKLEAAGTDANVTGRLIETPRARQILELAFPDRAALERMIRSAEAENQFARTRTTVSGPARRAAVDELEQGRQGASIAAALARGETLRATSGLLKLLGFGETSNRTRAELARALFRRDVPGAGSPSRAAEFRRSVGNVAPGAVAGGAAAAVAPAAND